MTVTIRPEVQWRGQPYRSLPVYRTVSEPSSIALAIKSAHGIVKEVPKEIAGYEIEYLRWGKISDNGSFIPD